MTFPELSQWDFLPYSERKKWAEAVAETLPQPFTYAGMETHTLGEQRHRIAYYNYEGSLFALIPGGECTLGCDLSRPINPFDYDDYDGEADNIYVESHNNSTEFGLFWLWHEGGKRSSDDGFLTELRTITLQPYLIEVTAKLTGPVDVPPRQFFTPLELQEFRRNPGYTEKRSYDNTRTLYVSVSAEGDVKVKVTDWAKHKEVVAALDSTPFRLPTSDEWEFACSGGSTTLFRWGNLHPEHCNPVPRIPDESECEPLFNLHKLPNAFGLIFPHSPYDWEICAEPGLMRGGDGGLRMHGGGSEFAMWIPLATSFACTFDPDTLIHTRYRRVYPVLI